MIKNPEFVRNLWLIQNPALLVITPLVVAVAFAAILAWKLTAEPASLGGRERWEVYAFGLFCVVNIYLGAIRALISISIEIKEHTWDGQQMSVIPPWSMAWGKLFGANALTWYAGFVCLALYLLTAIQQSFPIGEVLKNILVWICAGVIAQAVAMLASVVGLQRSPAAKREQSASVAAGMLLLPGCALVPLAWLNIMPDSRVDWFVWSIGALDLLLLAATAIAAWALVGLYFAMRREFRYTNNPLPWLAFSIFTLVLLAGFEYGSGDIVPMSRDGRWRLGGLLPLYAALILLYGVALSECTDWSSIRRLGRLFENREWKALINAAPRAGYSLAILAALVGGLVLFGDSSDWPILAGGQVTDETLIATLLFVSRDVGLILLLNACYPSDRSEFIAICYLAVIYSILPYAINLFADGLLPFLLPVPGEMTALAFAAVLTQVIVVYAVLGRHVLSIHREKI